jgi:hypothetical protein
MNSQTQRRSMSAGLQTVSLPPDAISLIREGNPAPKAAHPVIARTELKEGADPPLQKAESARITEKVDVPLTDLGKVAKTRGKESLPLEEPTVSRSFRLPESIPTALLRVATERRINRVQPWTQEEIVTEAITDWLKKNRQS